MNRINFSIIIPIRKKNKYLAQTLSHLKNQTFKNFEILVITDKISKTANPAQKRNLGAKIAKGKYLAFLDDDSYPDKNWLKNALKVFNTNTNLSAVCGPCLTPPNNNIKQIASGLVWSSWLGSGAAGRYRNSIQKQRFVDDYPTVNLIVKKSDFNKVKGFDTHHWPGEDTVLCLNLTKKLNKKILYHPNIVVYHHRREIFNSHLAQIKRYALHRGFFAKKFPQTSLRLGYFLPPLFVIYLLLISFLFLSPFSQVTFNTIYHYIPKLYLPKSGLVWTSLLITPYLLPLFLTFLSFLKQNNFLISLLATITIPITHIYYGIYFIIGLLKKNLSFTPRQT